MKIEFSREDVESIILQHAHRICPDYMFNKVTMPYSYIGRVEVEFEEEEVLEVGGQQ